MDDPFDLRRFVEAQNRVFIRVEAELAAGRKTSHWIWFVFPQIAGLSGSPLGQRFAISALGEAKAYLAHPLLGARLRHCVGLVNRVGGGSITAILGSPDDMKFRSCMTLFAKVDVDAAIFLRALDLYFDGAFDPATLARL